MSEFIDPSAYEKNVSRFRRTIPAVLRPKNVEELVAIVKAANQDKRPIYPVSTGKNWGFGSRLPVRDGTTVVDLSALNKIREVNESFGYAVIEPGVTQKMLADTLRGTGYYLDVTGSGAGTSVIGNALERGITYNSLRVDTVSNLQVLLGNGEWLNTGFGAQTQNTLAHLYEHGVGPDLTGLFFQSNFGIVVAATVRLRKRCAYTVDFKISFNDPELPAVFDELGKLRREGILGSIARTGDRARSFETLAPALRREYKNAGIELNPAELRKRYDGTNKFEWTSFGKIDGTPEEVAAKVKLISRRLKKCAKVETFSEKKIALAMKVAELAGLKDLKVMLLASESLRKLSSGEPTDAALEMVAWPESLETTDGVDRAPVGFILVVPLLPFTGADARHMVTVCRDVGAKFPGINMGITINTISERVLEGVISLKFTDRDQGHAAMFALNQALAKVHYLPYRLNVDTMDSSPQPAPEYTAITRALKAVFDPNGILSPGRYV